MRRVLVVLLAALLVAPAAVDAGAAPPSGVATSNVEHITTIPFDAGVPTGARQIGKTLYVAGAKSLTIYDVSDPLAPELLSITPTGFKFANEDVDSNGKILLMSDDTVQQRLHVWDVRDKTKPVEIAVLPDMRDHTFSCVLGCKWAYGARGSIVDLRKPSQPKVAGNWMPGMVGGYGFDVTEVSPGLILTSSRTMHFLDARKNPAKPKQIALGYTDDDRMIHSNLWPRKGKDDFFLVQSETPFTGTCKESSGAFETWDATRWRKTKTFRTIDSFRVKNGTYTDGSPAAGAMGCTNMWFEHHPTFKNGGLVAAAYFEHGTRFLSVDRKGQISEVGHFMPLAGSTIASYWITDRIVYAIDVNRGIDILRFKGDI